MKFLNIDVHRLMLSVSLGILVSILFSAGAVVQALFFNAVLGDATSICDALCETGFATTGSFKEWFFVFYQWYHVPLALLLSYVALGYRNLRSIFWAFTFGVFFAISIADTAIVLLYTDRNSLMGHYLSNALGAPVLGLVICLILIVIRKIAESLSVNSIISMSIAPIFLSTLLLLSLFILAKNFVSLTKSNFLLTLGPDFYGSFAVSDISDTPFGIFQKLQNIDALVWSGLYSDMELKVTNPNRLADVELYVFEGCAGKSTKSILEELPTANIKLQSKKDVRFQIREGMGSASFFSDRGIGGKWSIIRDGTTVVSLRPSEEEDKLSLSVISVGEEKLIHEEWHQEMWYRFEMNNFNEEKDNNSRIFNISVDDYLQSYEVTTDFRQSLKESRKCRPVSLTNNKASIAHFQITTLLRVTYPQIESLEDLKNPTQTTIEGLSGWFTVKGINPRTLDAFITSGDMTDINFMGDFRGVFLDGSHIEVKNRQWIAASNGAFEARIDGGVLELRGNAAAVHVEGVLINRSRWEQLGSAMRWLVTAIGAALAGVFFFIFKTFRAMWISNEVVVKIDD